MIDVVMPAVNEVRAVVALIDRMPACYRPIVVDNGSTVGTGDAARDAIEGQTGPWLGDRRVDAVIRPAVDGGFWALGLVRLIDGLCGEVRMRSPTTRMDLRDALSRRSASWQELGTVVDVDR